MDVNVTFSILLDHRIKLSELLHCIRELSISSSFKCFATNSSSKETIDVFDRHIKKETEIGANTVVEHFQKNIADENEGILSNGKNDEDDEHVKTEEDEKPNADEADDDFYDEDHEEDYDEDYDFDDIENTNESDLLNFSNDDVSKYLKLQIGTEESEFGKDLDAVEDDESGTLEDLKCNECGLQFKTKVRFEKHNCKRPRICDTCGKSFIDERRLRYHVKHVHQGVPYTQRPLRACDLCGKMVKNLTMHKQCMHSTTKRVVKVTMVPCTMCEKQFRNKRLLRSHNYYEHGIGEKSFKCELCDSTFLTEKEMKRHADLSHFGKEECECEHCGRKFKRKANLYQHVQFIHKKMRKHQCDSCEYASYTKASLREHKARVHIKSMSFQCEHCGKLFCSNMNKNRHIKITHAEKYVCRICGNDEIKSGGALRLHENRCMRRYVCEYCQLVCGDARDLKRHIGRMHEKNKQS